MATRVLAVPNVVIIGGGFGGLWAARALRRAPVTVTVVDRRAVQRPRRAEPPEPAADHDDVRVT